VVASRLVGRTIFLVYVFSGDTILLLYTLRSLPNVSTLHHPDPRNGGTGSPTFLVGLGLYRLPPIVEPQPAKRDRSLFMAHVYRTALVFALEELFGRVQIFGSELTLAKYCQKEWPSERGKQAIDEMMRNRGLN
jgi:hypothetical protein